MGAPPIPGAVPSSPAPRRVTITFPANATPAQIENGIIQQIRTFFQTAQVIFPDPPLTVDMDMAFVNNNTASAVFKVNTFAMNPDLVPAPMP
jgi:hypothetical protein